MSLSFQLGASCQLAISEAMPSSAECCDRLPCATARLCNAQSRDIAVPLCHVTSQLLGGNCENIAMFAEGGRQRHSPLYRKGRVKFEGRAACPQLTFQA